jgi:hypothetical protein
MRCQTLWQTRHISLRIIWKSSIRCKLFNKQIYGFVGLRDPSFTTWSCLHWRYLSRNSSHSEEKADKFFPKTHSLYDLFSSCTQQQSGNLDISSWNRKNYNRGCMLNSRRKLLLPEGSQTLMHEDSLRHLTSPRASPLQDLCPSFCFVLSPCAITTPNYSRFLHWARTLKTMPMKSTEP